tara:strand:- start:20354 stop:21157 length:804 start_codon:yes stop_codon:yes gene_type:complete
MLNYNISDLSNEVINKYQNADPFPNIYIDNFFDEKFLNLVLEEFPDLSKLDSIKYDNKFEKKFAGKGDKSFGPNTKKLMYFLNSEEFLIFINKLTGIEETLIGDPYFSGGGLHEIKKGGVLKIHADFNRHNKTLLDRRVNLLIYLNKDWKDSYGGHFELWDTGMTKSIKKIAPIFNRIAIFSTTDFSYHGHPDPLTCPDDRSRKSLALYYFSNGRPDNEKSLKDHDTLFKNRKGNISDKSSFKDHLKSFIRETTPPFIYKFLKSKIQ